MRQQRQHVEGARRLRAAGSARRGAGRRLLAAALGVLAAASVAAFGAAQGAGHEGEADAEALTQAYLGGARFQDLATAEAEGYVSTMDDLGCFEDDARGGMGLHYLNNALMDAELDPARPEALVYELDAEGNVAALVAHEYIVPVDAWDSPEPPTVLGLELHQHPVLPLWVLHAWLWKDNPSGMFQDYNPAVRLCPAGVKVFGQE